MENNKKDFKFIEKYIRKHTFGILSTADKQGKPHSVGMIYAVSPIDSNFCLYCITDKGYKKAKNIKENPNIAFVIPIPHHILRFVPSNAIQFQGTAEIIPINDEVAIKAFSTKRLLRSNLAQLENPDLSLCFIKIIPHQKIHCYGIGISLMKIRKDHSLGSYTVELPSTKS